MRGVAAAGMLVAAACQGNPGAPLPLEMRGVRRAAFDPRARQPPVGHDPLALAAASVGRIANPEPTIPPACYTRTGGTSNPCWVCHTHSEYPNLADDWELQQNYAFPPAAMVNPWRNLFRDRRALVGGIGDDALLAYIRTDNYGPLRRALDGRAAPLAWRPDVDLHGGFDAEGFARDGSWWRAVRYKPFPGTFWPTNGSAGDLYVRLPDSFRRDAAGQPSRAVYRENLALLEAAIGGGPDAALPATYGGGAAGVPVVRGLYPVGTELLHTVRYLDPDAPGFAARRMKEVRYLRKEAMIERVARADVYAALEAGTAPPFRGDPLAGLTTDLGWRAQAWIEDERGWLRLQTHEEQAACMGCHGVLGVTIDGTFAFARKVPGDAGWRVQDARGIPDRPQLGHGAPEYATYLERVGGGDELRANDELLARFFPGGVLDREALAAAAGDIGAIVLPSRTRALALDRAYLANVLEQSFVWGRDAMITPAANVQARIGEGEARSTGIGEAGRTVRDGCLPLAW